MSETIIDELKQAKNFAAYRRYKKWQQWKLAEIIGKNQATVSKYEDGSYAIPPEIVTLLHDNFGYSYDFHYNSTGPMELKNKDDGKSTLVKDFAKLAADNEQLRLRLNKLELTVRQLVRDLYADKHGVV